jgi:hypothetical protein
MKRPLPDELVERFMDKAMKLPEYRKAMKPWFEEVLSQLIDEMIETGEWEQLIKEVAQKQDDAQINHSPRFCVHCGQALIEGGRFCPGCGKEIQKL